MFGFLHRKEQHVWVLAPEEQHVWVLAPEEQYVYSPQIPIYPAPLGAACNGTRQTTSRSAGAHRYWRLYGYRHGAPPEHFAVKATCRKLPFVQSNID
jgi:hypothetical protein